MNTLMTPEIPKRWIYESKYEKELDTHIEEEIETRKNVEKRNRSRKFELVSAILFKKPSAYQMQAQSQSQTIDFKLQ